MMQDTTGLHILQGSIPVSAEDAPGLQAAADRLKGRDVSEWPVPAMEVNYGGLDLHCYASMANEQLSRDLIDAARDAKGG